MKAVIINDQKPIAYCLIFAQVQYSSEELKVLIENKGCLNWLKSANNKQISRHITDLKLLQTKREILSIGQKLQTIPKFVASSNILEFSKTRILIIKVLLKKLSYIFEYPKQILCFHSQ
jgi:hypothetical protein